MTVPQTNTYAATYAAASLSSKVAVAIITAPISATNQNLPQAQDGLEHEAPGGENGSHSVHCFS